MQNSIRIPPEQWGRGAVRTELPGARSNISKVGPPYRPQRSLYWLSAGAMSVALTCVLTRCPQGKRQPTPLQNSIVNAYQTHQNINQASRRALQPAETTTGVQSGGSCRDIVHGLREMQNQPEHRRGVASDAKRRAAYLDNVLQVRPFFRRSTGSRSVTAPTHSPVTAWQQSTCADS